MTSDLWWLHHILLFKKKKRKRKNASPITRYLQLHFNLHFSTFSTFTFSQVSSHEQDGVVPVWWEWGPDFWSKSHGECRLLAADNMFHDWALLRNAFFRQFMGTKSKKGEGHVFRCQFQQISKKDDVSLSRTDRDHCIKRASSTWSLKSSRSVNVNLIRWQKYSC